MEDITDSIIFPRGNKFPESYRKNFIGQVWVNNLVEQNNEWNCTIGNVTFEPGCRNNWHKHPGGQILLVTGGRGWFQEWGKDVQEIRPGDVVKISANKKHWHGAARDSWLIHLYITTNSDKGSTEWMEPVLDEYYTKLK